MVCASRDLVARGRRVRKRLRGGMRQVGAIAAAARVALETPAVDSPWGGSLLEANYEPPRVVALDESAFRRRLRFHTVLSDPERGVVFDLVEGRDRASAETAFARIEPQVRAQVETVVMDPYWQFRLAAERMFPHARIVADKFHIIRAIAHAAQKVRKQEGRRKVPRRRDGRLAPRSHNKRFEPSVFQIRWLFAKRASRLSEREQERLRAVFDMRPKIEVAWLMKEAFAAIYEAPDRAEAERRLEVWISNLDAADLPDLVAVWKQLERWREEILAYFDDRMTNAFAEGITNKIKVMKRVSYGFRDSGRYRQKVLLSFRHQRGRAG
jgi:transposase